MAWRQGVRVHLETRGGVPIRNEKRYFDAPAGVRWFSAPPNEQCRLRVEFRDDFDLKGGSAVKIVLALGREHDPPNSLHDVQCYWLRKPHLAGSHVFDNLMTWARSELSSGVNSPLTIPAAVHAWDPDEPAVETFNAMEGSIAVFIVRGHYLDPSIVPQPRVVASTDPPPRLRAGRYGFPRIMRWDWFDTLESPHGDSLTFEFHNEYDERTDDLDKRLLQRSQWRDRHQITDTSVFEANTNQDLHGVEPTEKAASSWVMRKHARPAKLRENPSSATAEAPRYSLKPKVEHEDQPRNTPRPASAVKKEIIEIVDDDDIVQPIFPARAPSAAPATKTTDAPQKRGLEEDEEMLKLKLDNNLIRQKRRKKHLKRQDQHADLDDDDEFDDMLLEENEIRQALRRRQLT